MIDNKVYFGLVLNHFLPFYMAMISACAPVHDRIPRPVCKELHPVESCDLHLHEQKCKYTIVLQLKDS